MSARDQAIVAILSKLSFVADGAVLGAALAYVAIRSFIDHASTSSALKQIKDAPCVQVSNLRNVIPDNDSAGSDGGNGGEGGGKLVVLKGTVEAMETRASGLWNINSSTRKVCYTSMSGIEAVIAQRTQSYIYNEWRGFFQWTSDVRGLLARFWNEQESSYMTSVPFVLVEGHQHPYSTFAAVDLMGSKHSLPLITDYHQMQPINATPYTILQALFGHEYPVGILEEEKILPTGKVITAVGTCRAKNGNFEIKSCRHLPYFLTDKTKDEMLVDLSFRTNILLWGGIIIGTVAISVLGYSIVRNWNRWKQWRGRRRTAQERQAAHEAQLLSEEDDDETDIPDGQLCVICLLRRRRSAFVPCGHLVCCQRCALSVERDLSPKCPVCRQDIRNSFRIYDS